MKTKFAKTPTLLQMEAAECGAAALGIVAGYYGLWISLGELRYRCGINRNGSNAANILKAARNMNMEASGYRWEVENLEQAEMPLIIHWKFNHFVVLEGFRNGIAYINDPAVGHVRVPMEEFVRSYTGIAIELKPNENFTKSGAPYSILKELASLLKREKGALAFLCFVALLMIVPNTASPVFTQIFLDDILSGKHRDWMTTLGIIMFATVLIQVALHSLRALCLTKWQTKFNLSESGKFFWHILRLPMSFFAQRFGGEVASRMRFNETIAGTLTGQFATALLDFIIALFYLLLLLQYSVMLTLIGVFFMTLNIALFFYMRKLMIELSMKMEQDAGKAYGTAMSGMLMIETLKANGNEGDFFSKWAGYRAKVAESDQRSALLNQISTTVPLFLAGVNSAIIMTVGGFRIMDGVMTAGMFVAFQNLMGNFQAPVNNLLGLGQTLQTTEMQMKRLDDVTRCEVDDMYNQDEACLDDARPEEDSLSEARLSGKIELVDISFGYCPLDKPLLENFSLAVEPGKWVALVGASGSGKSTISKITTGLYSAWNGKVLFDGKPRGEIARETVANSMGCVDQDIFLFSGTIAENISLFDATVPRGDIVKAAKDACIHDDILKVDHAYDGVVGENGNNFSGGQRQRLEIARALVHNPSMLILDEATSALDPITEEEILKNIRARGCSCLVVAHRLSAFRDCEEIIVLDKGSVVERGSHAQLMKNRGFYSVLVSQIEAIEGVE